MDIIELVLHPAILEMSLTISSIYIYFSIFNV